MNTVFWLDDPFAPPDTCPDCGDAVTLAQLPNMTVFDCEKCGSGWHLELGCLYRISSARSGRRESQVAGWTDARAQVQQIGFVPSSAL